MNYNGNDIGSPINNILDFRNCRDLCGQKDAPYFGYWNEKKRCYCKSSDAGRQQGSGGVSGVARGCSGGKHFF